MLLLRGCLFVGGCRHATYLQRLSSRWVLLAVALLSLYVKDSSAYCPGITCYADGSCLPLSKRCDGVRDCIDGRDEDDCELTCDPDSEIDCGDGKCLHSLQRCDGHADCASGIDEEHCDVLRHCRSSDFVCDRRRCIPARSRCNGARDCIDGTDEINCKSISCQSTSFACASRDQCVQEWQECDGRHDCRDGSDEHSCARLIKMSISPPSATVQPGDSVRFRCSARCPGRMQCTLRWSLAGGQALPAEARQHGGVLTLSPVAPWSSADYVCTVVDAPIRTASARLTVRSAPQQPNVQQQQQQQVSSASSDQRGRACELACPAGYFQGRQGGSAAQRCIPCACSGSQHCDPCSGVCIACTPANGEAGGRKCNELPQQQQEQRPHQKQNQHQEQEHQRPAINSATIVCDSRGTRDGRSVPVDGVCLCKANVVGISCDQCKGSTFYLSKDNPEGCIPCVCSGVSTTCVSSSLQRTKLTTAFGPTAGGVEFFGRETLPTTYQVVSVDTGRGQLQADISYLPRRHEYYWKLPQKYLGNRLVAYGGFLEFSVEYVPSWDTLTSRSARVILRSGNDLQLAARLSDNVDAAKRGSSKPLAVKVQLTEHSWRHVASWSPVSRGQFLQALSNVTEFLIEAAAKDDGAVAITKLGAIAMDVAGGQERASSGGGDQIAGDVARQVELCTCPPGYAGLSCEICQAGHYRRPLSAWGVCARCHCNGHSDQCDPATGVCIGCRAGTEGRRCERCASGWTGDATLGTAEACRRDASSGGGVKTESSTQRAPPSPQAPAPLVVSEVAATGSSGSGGVRVLEDRVMVAVGDAAVLTCDYAARGLPAVVRLTWARYDKAPLSSAARQEGNRLVIPRADLADAGRYVCTARAPDGSLVGSSAVADLLVDAPPNCPPCNHHGSRAMMGSRSSCSCRCKRFVEGQLCDRCIEGYYDLHGDNEDGCRPCYCSGLSQTCTSSNFVRYQKRMAQGTGRIEVVLRSGAEGGIRPVWDGSSWAVRGLDVLERSIARPLRLFWSLPAPFIGYQGDSYGGYLEYSVEYAATPQSVRDIDVELVSNGQRAHYLLAQIPSAGARTAVRVPMTEHGWRTNDGRPLMRADFMRLLANVSSILVRLTYARGMLESRLHDPRLSGARTYSASSPGEEGRAREVELCTCPAGYVGSSCQDCAQGYARNKDGTCYSVQARPQPANIVAVMQDIVLTTGGSGSLICPSAWSDATYLWLKDGGTTLPLGAVARGRQLQLYNASWQLEGIYSCRAASTFGVSLATARVSVATPLRSPQRIVAPLGSPVSVECTAAAEHDAGHLLYWQSPRGHKVTVSTPRRSVLKFGYVTHGHAGNYTCVVEKDKSIVSTAATEIVVPASAYRRRRSTRRHKRSASNIASVSLRAGADAVLSCRKDKEDLSFGHHVTWSRVDGLPQSNYSWTEDGNMHIKKLQESDAGIYQCTSNLGAGRLVVKTVYLIITDGLTGA